MGKFIKYPSIDQFRDVVRNVTHKTRYDGKDETGAPIYTNRTLPVINVTLTEKIHGTNAGVCYSNRDGFWVQKRTSVCTPENDNAGCAFTAHAVKDVWIDLIKKLAEYHDVDLDKSIITVFYEWCGGNIQKLSAVSGLSKRAIIFQHAKVTNEDGSSKWIPTKTDEPIKDEESLIFNIMDFPTYEFEIDFNKPQIVQNDLVELVLNTIEPNSPVGKKFGIENNIGEGVVASFILDDELYQFKVKGEKHSNSKVTTLPKVDNEQIQKLQDLAQKVTPAWRLEQMFDLANDTINGKEPETKNIGEFMRLLNQDIIKEETNTIHEQGLDLKAISKYVSVIARDYFFSRINQM